MSRKPAPPFFVECYGGESPDCREGFGGEYPTHGYPCSLKGAERAGWGHVEYREGDEWLGWLGYCPPCHAAKLAGEIEDLQGRLAAVMAALAGPPRRRRAKSDTQPELFQ